MAMKEIFGPSVVVPLRKEERLDYWREDIQPNLPWADEHFDERVGGQPLNPGKSWLSWPWSNSADQFRIESGGKFAHTYMERFWPKYAGAEAPAENHNHTNYFPIHGVRYEYGDLNDLVNHLVDDPLSRQAYLPVWFPEDGTCTGRRPCSLGYHFLMRHDHLHLTYGIRSCDLVRHWADDCYLAVRLLLWVLDRLREKRPEWKDVKPGLYTMNIASLHCFINDWRKLGGKEASSPV
jgi:hypothetical protein